jgi:hypothetical protein
MSLDCAYVLLYLEWSFDQLEFWEGCSQVTRYSNPFQDIIKSHFQKTPKFELDQILDQNPYSNPFQDIIKSYTQI